MVYRGIPSDGCKECRKSKKRCDLQWPACARCVRLRRSCSGCKVPSTSTDAIHFLLYDARSALDRKERAFTLNNNDEIVRSGVFDPRTLSATCTRAFPSGVNSSCLAFQDAIDHHTVLESLGSTANANLGNAPRTRPSLPTFSFQPNPDDIAINYFLTHFTSVEPGLWSLLMLYKSDKCLDLVMRACGMAAFAGVNNVSHGAAYARSLYVDALSLVNPALGDPERRKTDETLIAVRLLGIYEALTSGEQESFQSWKVHVDGVSQLLKMRGQDQLKSMIGRLLFREIEGEILVKCIWDEIQPPEFILDWEDDLEAMSEELGIRQPVDSLSKICFSFATLRAKIRSNMISDHEAAKEAASLNTRIIEWSSSVVEIDPAWNWSLVDVPDSPHVWNGLTHQYNAGYICGVWMACRGIRILIFITQERLRQKTQLAPIDQTAEAESLRRNLRQITDDICAAVPCMLNHDPATGKPSCSLINAYNAIWPLFLAGIWAVERCRAQAWHAAGDAYMSGLPHSSASLAQAAWIIGRLEYIATHFGLHWARYTAATLRRDLELQRTSPPEPAMHYFVASRSLKR